MGNAQEQRRYGRNLKQCSAALLTDRNRNAWFIADFYWQILPRVVHGGLAAPLLAH